MNETFKYLIKERNLTVLNSALILVNNLSNRVVTVFWHNIV